MSSFGREFARRMGERRGPIAAHRAVAAILLARTKMFTAPGLERAIGDNWSLVAELAALPPTELKSFMMSMPAVSYAATILVATGGKEAVLNIVDEIDVAEIIQHVKKRQPDHAAVLARHPKWITSEIAWAKERWLTTE